MLKASRFVQLELESGAWLTFFKKGFQKAPLVRGGGVGNSGHRGASRANPTLGDIPERSRPSLRDSKAASRGESRIPLLAVPSWHARLAEMGPTVLPSPLRSPRAGSHLYPAPAAGKGLQRQPQRWRVPRAPRALSLGCSEAVCCSRGSGDSSRGRVVAGCRVLCSPRAAAALYIPWAFKPLCPAAPSDSSPNGCPRLPRLHRL